MDDTQAIEAALQAYFDGLYEGDIGKLASCFHETADLRAVSPEGKLAMMTRQQWFDYVTSRPSAASRGLARHDWVVTLDRSGPATAFAKVNCQLPPRYFTDYLVLGKLAEGWKIISKTYHTETR
jgi:hypothetical protein